jgi:predicted nucleotidyltransferase
MSDPNTALLSRMAEALGDLCEQVVFVGGCATSLLIDDPAAPPVRATQDVDAVVAVQSMAEYLSVGNALRSRGFAQTLEAGDPPYRWSMRMLKLDIMPADEGVLGFSSRWYRGALETAEDRQLPNGVRIRVVLPAYFLATKLDAFEDRGRGDYYESHDFEDILSVVDGRSGIVADVARAPVEVRRYIAGVFGRLIASADFVNVLPGLILDGSPATRAPQLMEKLRLIADLKD